MEAPTSAIDVTTSPEEERKATRKGSRMEIKKENQTY
jgi:hypothetical protein